MKTLFDGNMIKVTIESEDDTTAKYKVTFAGGRDFSVNGPPGLTHQQVIGCLNEYLQSIKSDHNPSA